MRLRRKGSFDVGFMFNVLGRYRSSGGTVWSWPVTAIPATTCKRVHPFAAGEDPTMMFGAGGSDGAGGAGGAGGEGGGRPVVLAARVALELPVFGRRWRRR